ncbi:hypothetical protein FQA39_LY19341 [Lamprigera yunnana]|nr:hypothetical protein FQA39_LY19341 [Lamprigera yunnana]
MPPARFCRRLGWWCLDILGLAIELGVLAAVYFVDHVALAALGERDDGDAGAAHCGDDFGEDDVFVCAADCAQMCANRRRRRLRAAVISARRCGGPSSCALLFGRMLTSGYGQGFGIEAAVGRAAFGGDGAHQKADAALADIQQIARFCTGGFRLVGAADFANHDDGVGVRIVVEGFHHVDVLEAIDRVAANAHGGRLANAQLAQLRHGFIRQGARAADHADAAFFVDVAGHDADLDLSERVRRGALGPASRVFLPPAASLARILLRTSSHVRHGDAFGDADRQIQVGFQRFPDGSGCACGRHVDHGDGGAGFLGGVFDGAEDRDVENLLARLLGVHTGDEAVLAVGVFLALFGVELARLAGDALGDDARVFVDVDRHCSVLQGLLDGGDGFDDLGGRISHRVHADDGQARFGQHLLAQLFVGALHAHDQRHLQVHGLAGGDDAGGDGVALHDAAEDVDQNAFNLGVLEHDLEGFGHLLGRGATAYVEEVGGLRPPNSLMVYGGHGQTGALTGSGPMLPVQADEARSNLEAFRWSAGSSSSQGRAAPTISGGGTGALASK